MSRTGKSIETERRLGTAQDREQKWRLTVNGHDESYWGDDNV